MPGEIELLHDILINDLGYRFIDEYSRASSDINLYKYEKNLIYDGIYQTRESCFYAHYKTGKVETIIVDGEDKEKFNELYKLQSREKSIDSIIEE